MSDHHFEKLLRTVVKVVTIPDTIQNLIAVYAPIFSKQT